MRIIPYKAAYNKQWEDLFAEYWFDILGNTPDPPERRDRELRFLSEFILRQLQAGVIRLDIAVRKGVLNGFILYQIDSPKSDWCKKPGWGCIREFCILPAAHRQGIGRELLTHAERQLKEQGASQVYLQSFPAADGFYEKCGYADSGETGVHDQKIYIKSI